MKIGSVLTQETVMARTFVPCIIGTMTLFVITVMDLSVDSGRLTILMNEIFIRLKSAVKSSQNLLMTTSSNVRLVAIVPLLKQSLKDAAL